MKHERVLDADYRSLLAPAVPVGPVAAYHAVPFGQRAERGTRWLALSLTVMMHALLGGLLLASWGHKEPALSPSATSVATFDVGAAPSEVSPSVDPITPPEPVVEVEAQRSAIDMPEVKMPSPLSRATPIPDKAAGSAKPAKASEPAVQAVQPRRMTQVEPDRRATDAAPAAAPVASKEASNAYGAEVMAHLARFRRPNAIGPGSATIGFSVSAEGGVSSASVARGSGSKRFDREALDMVRRAAPYPKPPPGVNRDFSVEMKGQ